ncbi:GIY-YIG nuclease family protein [Thioalkalivibrio sulfidiphilus]|uniref:GIY-YIG nuclease family protein n=1 Tax=Thioalkalivibrio sulfidiphilus TaxID=1033854 RepID=UPI00037C4936|nr:GIY-YIG nuclease family protein [Thioalkalivibrio sulfidiphilus]
MASGKENATYQLLIVVDEAVSVRVGQLGEFAFAPGYYVYTGSARRGMKARLKRHLARDKRLRWHIDYLLANPHVTVVDVQILDQPECEVNQYITGTIPVPGFGASDCTAGCGAHLFEVRSVNWEG